MFAPDKINFTLKNAQVQRSQLLRTVNSGRCRRYGSHTNPHEAHRLVLIAVTVPTQVLKMDELLLAKFEFINKFRISYKSFYGGFFE